MTAFLYMNFKIFFSYCNINYHFPNSNSHFKLGSQFPAIFLKCRVCRQLILFISAYYYFNETEKSLIISAKSVLLRCADVLRNDVERIEITLNARSILCDKKCVFFLEFCSFENVQHIGAHKFSG